jgi:amino acid transporter
LIVIMLPLVAPTTQSASYVFAKVNISSDSTGITSPVYSVILAWLVSQYSLYGYDAAAHLTEETRNAGRHSFTSELYSRSCVALFHFAS